MSEVILVFKTKLRRNLFSVRVIATVGTEYLQTLKMNQRSLFLPQIQEIDSVPDETYS